MNTAGLIVGALLVVYVVLIPIATVTALRVIRWYRMSGPEPREPQPSIATATKLAVVWPLVVIISVPVLMVSIGTAVVAEWWTSLIRWIDRRSPGGR